MKLLKALWLGGLLSFQALHASAIDVGEPRQLLARSISSSTALVLSAEDKQWLKNKHHLLLGTTVPDYPPFDINVSSNDYEGLTADYAGLIGELLGIPIKVRRFTDRAQAIAALHAGKIDMLGSSNAFEAADAQLVLSHSYTDDQPVIVTAPGNSLRNNDTLEGLRLAMVDHYLPQPLVSALYPQAKLQLYSSALAGLSAVALGQADAFLGDAVSSDYLITRVYLGNVQVDHFIKNLRGTFAFAVSRNNPTLLRLVDQALDRIGDNDRLNILRRWTSGSTRVLLNRNSVSLSAAERAWIEQHPRLRVAINKYFAPMTFFDEDHQFRGITADVLDQISIRTGLKFDIHAVDSVAQIIEQLEQGDVDIAAVLPPTPAREATLHFSRPYLITPRVLVTRTDNHTLHNAEQLKGKRLALIRDFFPLETDLRLRYPETTLVLVDDPLTLMESVEQGKADAALSSQINAAYFVSHLFKDKLQIASIYGDQPGIASFAVARNAKLLQSILDKALLSIPPDDMTELTGRWRTNALISDSLWYNYRGLIVQILLAAGALIIAVIIWNRYLRELIRRRSEAEQALQTELAFSKRLLEELRLAKEQAENASRAKSTFLATMSHEIRTPMNAVIGLLELAIEDAAQGRVDRTSLQVAFESANGLLELIGDILDIVRIEAGHMSLAPQPTDLNNLITATVRVFEGNARLKGLRLEVDLQPTDSLVAVDALRLKQILSNLVSNAIKFTDQGSVNVSLSVDHSQAGQLQILLGVEDSGIGISAADQQQLFQHFAQVGAHTSRQGTGLGLIISRNLCELMGGQLHLQSAPNQGTRVHVALTLPLAEPATETDNMPVTAADSLPALAILVVDDYPANLMLLERQLTLLGHRVSQASDGQQALALWHKNSFDAVITDCHMPVMDGHQLARQIRAQERQLQRPACVVLGLTANAQAQERERCLASGMNDCLFKPIGLAQLRRHLQGMNTPVAAPQTAEDEEHASGFDIDNLRYLTLGDPSLVRRLLDELTRSNGEDLEALRALGSHPSRANVRALAHRIKGGAKMLKAHGVVRHCQAVEQACLGDASNGQLKALLGNLEQSLLTLKTQLIQAHSQ
ncbi:transporter substrate-binding domain-containing protein [Pseudomonas sp. UM16]|uniref:transporter substrate-binding domain-containing protein n=1 Tax=Pseudomonas sp. UM16 TaxID=3158962 RepID=UPI00398FEA39